MGSELWGRPEPGPELLREIGPRRLDGGIDRRR